MNDKEILERVEKIINDVFVQEYLEKEDRVALEIMYKHYKKYIECEKYE